ncbi:cobaltochelatase subunit CobN [Marinicella pacifica]|uniref:Cobaltochelatase subunit CobN n=1 Tax=Marinicella pacifica TaxID=1171543 RepID=A0A917CCU7_9GAMM|nr:cobaltochelatase subunit CobN [Marinicella pacifica]GGF84715.1 cobaltochelatase subunit CobN [Marinicella pacifica]
MLRLSLFLWLVAGTLQAQTIQVVTDSMMLSGKKELLQTSAQNEGLTFHMVEKQDLSPDKLNQVLRQGDFVLVDLARSFDMTALIQQTEPAGQDYTNHHFWYASDEVHHSNLSAGQADLLLSYYRHGGRQNMAQFMLAVKLIIEDKTIAGLAEPLVLPEAGVYYADYPQQFTADASQMLTFLKTDAEKPVIAIGFHPRYIESTATEHIDELVKIIEQKGVTALPLFYSLGDDVDLPALVPPEVDVLIHMQPVYHNGLEDQLNTLGIPVMQGIGWWGDSIDSWREDVVGLSLSSTPLYLALPEQNGLIDPLVMWAEHEGVMHLIPEQVNAAVNKAVALAKLRKQPKAKQKVAVMVYNYPPGQHNFSASYLNVPRSLANLSAQWQKAGYQTQALTEQAFIDGFADVIGAGFDKKRREQMLSENKAHWLSLTDYQQWYQQLPEKTRARIEDYWGKPADFSLISEQSGEAGFIVPVIESGNMVYLPQPSRGTGDIDQEKQLYHDTRVPVSHAYLVSYLWVRDRFNADALIHFGTHGTQEWMAGKERGLSATADDPYVAIGDIPIIYPYIMDDVGEAVQAKRRGRAVMVSHQTPAFRASGLHGTLVDAHDLIHQWENLEPGEVKANTLNSLMQLAKDESLTESLAWTEQQVRERPEDFIFALHDYLHELAAQSQPIGLHTFATDSPEQQKISTVMQMLGQAFIDSFDLPDSDELLVQDYEKLQQTEPYQWLVDVILNDKKVNGAQQVFAEQAREMFNNLRTDGELAGLTAALSGQHVSPQIGGDPIRVPDALPTGGNLVGFDPAKLPNKEAWLAGKKAAKELINDYHQKHGEYPNKLAFSLWAVEAMRHGGVLESQAFYAMGVEPVWGRGGRVSGYRVIPSAELKRPRVDVVLSVTGLYRDQFPNVMEKLAKAAAEVAQLDEADNQLYKNTQTLLADLLKQDIPKEQAENMAQTRVFGSPTGVYGTGLDDATLASDTWESDEKLAKLYLKRMSHAFGPDPEQWSQGDDASDLYAQQLKTVDAALLARSSNLYGMLTTDDPFQYLGGIDLAVRHLSGKSPELYISNQRKQGEVQFQTADEFLSLEMNSRAFHPGWIKSLKDEGYAGALHLQDMTNNLWGWQSVSPDVVKDYQWQNMHDIYVQDKLELDINEWFEEHAPEAQVRMMERMIEAVRKDFWAASDETKKQLLEAYIEKVNKHQFTPASKTLSDFVDQQAVGFGLMPLTAATQQNTAQSENASKATGQSQQVQGQKLVKQTASTAAEDKHYWWLFLLAVPFFIGIIKQNNRTAL